jgi:hypothetical protein
MNASPAEHASRVHQALWRLAHGDEVCATIEQVADASGLREHKVRRSLASLVRSGEIVPAGKRDKTTVFRLSSSSPGAETPSRRDSPQGGSSSTNGRSAAHSDPAASAKAGNEDGSRSRRDSLASAEDRKHLDEFEFTPELCAAGIAWAEEMVARYSGHPSPPAVLLRRGSLRDEPLEWRKGRLDISERHFEGAATRKRIWLPPQAPRFPEPREGGVAER